MLALEEAQARGGDREGAKRTGERAAALARKLRDPERLARAGLGIFPSATSLDEVDPSIAALLEEALEGLGDGPDLLRARILGRLAIDYGWQASWERRVRSCEEAVEVARRLGDPGTLAYALAARYIMLWGAERASQGRAIAREVIGQAERTGDRIFALTYRVYYIDDLLGRGATPELDAEISAFARAAEEFRLPQLRCYALLFRRMRALMTGRLEEAERCGSELSALAEQIREAVILNGCGAQILIGEVLQGRAEGVLPAVEAYVDRYGLNAAWRAGLAWAYLHADRLEEARRAYEPLAGGGFSSVQRDMNWCCSVAFLSEVCARLGDCRRAEWLYQALLPCADLHAVAGVGSAYLGSVSRYLGLLAVTRGRFEEAERHFRSALEAEARVGASPWVERTRSDLERMLRARRGTGDRRRAKAVTLPNRENNPDARSGAEAPRLRALGKD
jgi:tetratricopeptide (TPR) repeat protein